MTIIKALFVIDTLEIGGAEQSLLDNISKFRAIEPIVCHLYKGDKLKSKFESYNIKVYSINIEKKYAFSKAFKSLSKIVELEKPNIIVGYLTRSELVSRIVARRFSIPIIGTFVSDLYSPTYNNSLNWSSKKKVSFFKYLNKLTSKLCNGFIANSYGIMQTNSKALGIPTSNIKVIHRGRSSERFVYNPRTYNEQRTLKFLNIGRLFSVKGQSDLILAFNIFQKQFPDCSLDIIGEGPFRKELMKLIAENQLQGKVELIGAQFDVDKLINQYDCFIFPSYSEGFSGSVVEAMFSGLPVLASNIPANLEAIKHLETGYLFEKGNITSIVESMQWFIENRRQASNMAARAREYAMANFEISNVSEEFENYLLSINKG